MAVTETLKALGSWSLKLKSTIPIGLIEKLEYFGHIAVHPGTVDPRVDGDGLLKTSRYTGVLRDKSFDGLDHTIGGPGMAMWLGDADKKGDVVEALLTLTGVTFENAIRAGLPTSGAVTEGTLFNIGSAPFSATFQYLSSREIIDYICTTLGADWIVRGDATLDAGLESDLFVTNPRTALIRRNPGTDRFLKAFSGKINASEDVQDFTTRVLLLAQGSEGSTSSGSATISPGLNPYKDLHGNSVKMTRIVSESSTDPANANARAQLQLNRFTSTRNSLTLSTGEYDIKGDVQVGDYLWVYDPETGLEDVNEINFRGDLIFPVKLRLTEMTWPVIQGMSVSYRDYLGVWYDLTPHVEWETGETTLVVGGYNRSLTSGSDGGAAGSRPQPNTTVPAITVWVEPFVQSVYQSTDGNSKAQVDLHWLRPNNTDATAIIDGDHYEIRYRNSSTPVFPVTWDQIAGYTYNQIEAAGGTWDHPIQYTPGEWQYATVPWDQLHFMLQELTTNMPYEAEIRAVDNGTPANYGAWSLTTVFQTSGDTLPPATPAAISTVAASILSIQVVHELGRAEGGTFNLDRDLHHLEIHGEYEPNFAPNDSTLLGKVIADAGMMDAQVPIVASFSIDQLNPTYFKVVAVDVSGNKSQGSVAVQATALLVDDAHIINLTVSKITAGTITADWLMAGTIRTGISPNARVQIRSFGLEAYNANNVNTFWVDSATGNVWMKGQVKTGDDNESRIVINPGQNNPRIVFYPTPNFDDHVDMTVEAYTDPRGVFNTGIKITAVDQFGFPKGGEIEFGQTGVKIAHYNNSTLQWAYYWIDEQSRHTIRGTWNINNFDPYAALVIGQTGYSAVGDGGVAYSYGMTFAGNLRIIGTVIINNAGGGDESFSFYFYNLSHQSGFTALWARDPSTGTVERSGSVNFWGFRIA